MRQAAEDHTAICWAVAAPEGNQNLFTGSSDSTARKWCTETGEQLVKYSGHAGVCLSVSHILTLLVAHSLKLLRFGCLCLSLWLSLTMPVSPCRWLSLLLPVSDGGFGQVG